MTLGFRRCTRLATVLGLALTAASLAPSEVRAADPEGPATGPATDSLAPFFDLGRPQLLAASATPASFFIAPPVLAKRARDREFDTSMGEKDPRVRPPPRPHRFRLALHSHWVRLSRTPNEATGEVERFHFAPLMLDLAYQAQFLKYVMVRIAVAAGGNVANSRNAMPLAVFPQGYLGYQGKIVGLAFGYGFDWTIPPTFGAKANASNALEQPVITRNHVVMGELSATSKIDKTALTFSFSIGGVQSDLSHYDTYNRKWRLYLGFQLGAFFDGSRRREKKALKKAEAEGR